MKASIPFYLRGHPCRRVAGVIVLLSGIVVADVNAQTAVTPVERGAIASAVATYQSGEAQKLETAVESRMANRGNSAAKHFLVASRMAVIAMNLRQTGDLSGSTEVAERALARLVVAENALRGPVDRELAAAIKHLCGVLHERIIGDTDSAMNYFEAAVSIDASSRASIAIERLKHVRPRSHAGEGSPRG